MGAERENWIYRIYGSAKLILCSKTRGRRKWQPTPVENPVDRGDWRAAVHRVTQSQKRLKQISMHAGIGEGNDNPLQSSCLENPRDRGAWWAAIYGVAENQTQLKRLSSSSSSSSKKRERGY